MATVNTKATIVTNLDATPRVQNPLYLMGGVLREQVGTVEIAAGDDNNSTYRVGRVHSSWRVSEIKRFNDAVTSGTTFDVGLYDTAANGGAAVDDDLFGTDINLTSGSTTGVNDVFEALNIDKVEKPVWEALGLASDPGKFYDVVYKGQVVGSGAATLSVQTRYVANS